MALGGDDIQMAAFSQGTQFPVAMWVHAVSLSLPLFRSMYCFLYPWPELETLVLCSFPVRNSCCLSIVCMLIAFFFFVYTNSLSGLSFHPISVLLILVLTERQYSPTILKTSTWETCESTHTSFFVNNACDRSNLSTLTITKWCKALHYICNRIAVYWLCRI